MGQTIRIIGIDPGLRRTGWGVIERDGSRLSHVADGMLSPNECGSLADRLVELKNGLEAVLAAYVPDEAAVEETFVNNNARATLKLGHARAVALIVPAMRGLRVAEYAPNEVKKAVVGAGHAEKQQVSPDGAAAAAQVVPGDQRCRRRPGGSHLPCPPSGRAAEGLSG